MSINIPPYEGIDWGVMLIVLGVIIILSQFIPDTKKAKKVRE